MIRIAIVTEGPTEAEFVKQVLADHLRERGILPIPILPRRGSSGGGDVSVDRLVSRMAPLFYSHDAVTSLVDFYGFKKKGDKTTNELQEELTRRISEKLEKHWHSEMVFPYVQKHEFEGLLFSNVKAFAKVPSVSEECVKELHKIRQQFKNPEEINDNKETAPSKRIKKLIPRYNKKVHSYLIAAETGLEAIRAECPLFDGWMTRLESLGDPSGSE